MRHPQPSASNRTRNAAKRRPAEIHRTVRRIVMSAMAGRGDFDKRMVDDLHPMVVEPEVKATDFHLNSTKRADRYARGRSEVLEDFRENLGPCDPMEMEKRLRRVLDIVRQVASTRNITRAYILQPELS